MSNLKKSITFISYGLTPCAIGGAEIFNFHLIRSLKDVYKLKILTSCRQYREEGTKEVRIFSRLFIFKRMGLWKLSAAVQEIFHILCSSKTDLYILTYTSNSEYLGFYYPILMKLINKKYMIINHGGGIRPWCYPKSTKRLFTSASINIAISIPIKEEYEKRLDTIIDYIPPLINFNKSEQSVDIICSKFNIPLNKKILLSVGSLKQIKNPIVLLRAFLKLGKEYVSANNLLLVYAGSGPLRDEMEDLIYENNFGKYVKLLGFILNEEICHLYKISSLFIINSVYEGTSIALLEAMFNKCLIIASNSPGINSIIENNERGLLYEYNNVFDLKLKLTDAINNYQEYKYMIDNSLNYYVQSYDHKKMINKYISSINDI